MPDLHNGEGPSRTGQVVGGGVVAARARVCVCGGDGGDRVYGSEKEWGKGRKGEREGKLTSAAPLL